MAKKKIQVRFKIPGVSSEQKEVVEAVNGPEARKILAVKYPGFKHIATKTGNF